MMPVRRYRSVAAMEGLPPRRPLDSTNLKMAFDLMDLAARLSSTRYPPGVRKFKSLEEADRYGETLRAAEIRDLAGAHDRRHYEERHSAR